MSTPNLMERKAHRHLRGQARALFNHLALTRLIDRQLPMLPTAGVNVLAISTLRHSRRTRMSNGSHFVDQRLYPVSQAPVLR